MCSLLPLLFVVLVSPFHSWSVVPGQSPSPDKLHRFPQQKVVLDEFATDAPVLDLGGGGEGIIGQLQGKKVIAVDLMRRELEEAPAGPLVKIVMDARDLKFLDASFPTVTAFFTLMYIDGTDHEKVFRETSRVLRPGGRFLVWDAILPERLPGKEFALFRLEITLPSKTVSTGYGVRWPAAPHDLDYYLGLARATGFEVVKHSLRDQWFSLELRKP